MGDPVTDPDRRDRGRHPSLLRRLFYANAAVLLVAGVLLVVTPVTIGAPVALGEFAIIAAALVAMLGATSSCCAAQCHRSMSSRRSCARSTHSIRADG